MYIVLRFQAPIYPATESSLKEQIFKLQQQLSQMYLIHGDFPDGLKMVTYIAPEQFLLAFPDISLKNDNIKQPIDELVAWIKYAIHQSNLPFQLVDGGISPVAAHIEVPLLNELVLTNPENSASAWQDLPRPSVPGMLWIFQATEAPTEAVSARIPNDAATFIKMLAACPVSLENPRLRQQTLLSNYYLHSTVPHGFILAVPCAPEFFTDGNMAQKIQTSLSGVPEFSDYNLRQTFYKYDSCFGGIYPDSRNQTFAELMQISAANIPDKFLCEITRELMTSPMKIPVTENVVEKAAMEIALSCHGHNPFNRQPLAIATLENLSALGDEINAFLHVHSVEIRLAGEAKQRQNDFVGALTDYLKVYQYIKFNQSIAPEEYTNLLYNIACAYRDSNDTTQAIKFFHALLIADLKLRTPIATKVQHLAELSELHYSAQRYGCAQKYYIELIQQVAETGMHYDNEASVSANLAHCKSVVAANNSSRMLADPLQQQAKTLDDELFEDYTAMREQTALQKQPYSHPCNHNLTKAKCVQTKIALKLAYPADPVRQAILKLLNERHDFNTLCHALPQKIIKQWNVACNETDVRLQRNATGDVTNINMDFSIIIEPSARTNIDVSITSFFHQAIDILRQLALLTKTTLHFTQGDACDLPSFPELNQAPMIKQLNDVNGKIMQVQQTFVPILKQLQKAVATEVGNNPNYQSISVSVGRSNFNQALRRACHQGATRIVNLLIDYNEQYSDSIPLDFNEPTSDGRTPLDLATAKEHQPIIERLLAKGAKASAAAAAPAALSSKCPRPTTTRP